MVIANQAIWTPSLVLGLLAAFGIISLILFGITLTFVAGFYVARVARGYLSGERTAALQERVAGARQAGNLALVALACGPILSGCICLVLLPILIWFPDFRLLHYIGMSTLMIGVGTLAGIIGGGAFWASSTLMGQVRKTLNKRGRGRAWDTGIRLNGLRFDRAPSRNDLGEGTSLAERLSAGTGRARPEARLHEHPAIRVERNRARGLVGLDVEPMLSSGQLELFDPRRSRTVRDDADLNR